MKAFNSLAEYRDYINKRNRDYYHQLKADPARYELHLAKRRAYQKKRYRELLSRFSSPKQDQ